MDRKWWTLLAVCAGTFMLLLDVTIVVVVLPQVQHDLHAGFGQLQWMIDAYALTLAALLLTSGVLADRYGRRRLFAIGLVIFTAGSALCGAAQSPAMLIASRSAQGIGGAIMYSTSLALLAQSFHGRDRGIAFGVWGGIAGVAVALGPVLGGAITTGISWRGVFLVNLPVGIAALAVTLLKVEESRAPRPGRPDWVGFVLLTGGLISLVYGLTEASQSSWGRPVVLVTLIGGGVALAAFLVAERLVRHPMFDLGLFRTPTFVGGAIAAVTMNGSLFAMLVYLVLYLQDSLGFSALGTGLRLLVNSGAMFCAAVVSGRLSERVSIRWLIAPGLALVGAGLLLMGGLDGSSTWTHLIPGFAVAGLGAGLVNPPLASTAVGVVEPARAGMASGVNSTFRQIGLATSVATLATIFSSALSNHVRSALRAVPSLAGHAGQFATALSQGNAARFIGSAPASARRQLADVARSSFAAGLNDLLLVSGVIALVGAATTVFLIRRQDFVGHGAPAPEAGAGDTDGRRLAGAVAAERGAL